jgi:nucleoside phosphorylase
MRILVTFAVEAEFAPWRAIRRFQKVKINEKHSSGGADVLQTSIGENVVWVLLTGMGIKLFDHQTACCLRDAGLDVIVSSGLVGALKPNYSIGDVLVPKSIADLRDVAIALTADTLCEFAEDKGAILIGTLLTSDHIVKTEEEKSRLAIFGDAVDMESVHVMKVFQDLNLPMVTVRAVSDASNEDLPLDFAEAITPDGKVKMTSLFKQLLDRPAKILALVRFGQRSKSAARKLAKFLDEFVGSLTPEVVSRERAAAGAHE